LIKELYSSETNLLNLWRIEFVTISSERIISKEAASPEFEGNHTLSGIRIPLEEHSQLLDQFFFCELPNLPWNNPVIFDLRRNRGIVGLASRNRKIYLNN